MRRSGQYSSSRGGASCATVLGIGLVVVAFAFAVMQANSGRSYPIDTPDFIGYAAQDSLPPPAPAVFPSVDPLVAVGGLAQARAEHTANLLPDGRVIVVGGVSMDSGSPAALTSIESYDPNTRSFTLAGELLTPRADHIASILQDGTLLIAGGKGGDGRALASAEIYDPKTGVSHPVGDMTAARVSASAVLLADGTVFIVGGTDNGPVWSAELYEPSSGTFKSLGSFAWADGAVPAVRLSDGRVLVAGGGAAGIPPTAAGIPTTAAEIYDPAARAFTWVADIQMVRTNATSCLLGDGRVLIVGGLDTNGNVNLTAETMDPNGQANPSPMWLGDPRVNNTTTAVGADSALVVGGIDSTGVPIATVELYLPGKEFFEPIGTMSEARSRHTATLLADGSVLIVGGWSSASTVTADAGLYSPDSTPLISPTEKPAAATNDGSAPTGASPNVASPGST
jgi:hypothetical protein